ncbi:MAG: hypothetical protein ABIC57_01330 [bacterium]
MLVVRDRRLQFKKNQDFAIHFEGDSVSLLKVGDMVQPSTAVFEGQASRLVQSMSISRELGVPPSQVKKYVVVSDGEIVDKGDVIAKRSVSMGMMERVVKAISDGRLSYRRIDAGVVDIMSPFSESVVTSGVYGRVRLVMPETNQKRQIILSTDAYVAKPVICDGESVSGKLEIIKDGSSIYFPEDVSSECRGKLIVAGRELDSMLYEALIEVGALGVIVGGMNISDFINLGVKAIPIFVMEGWGIVPIDSILLNFFLSSKGCYSYMDTVNERLVIYNSSHNQEIEDGDEYLVDVEEGMTIQVWDQPYWGFSGIVENVLEEEDLIQVKFSSGRKVLVRPGSARVIE